MVCIPNGDIGSGLAMAHMQAMKKKTYVTWRRFFVYLLGGKCNKCDAVENLEIDHIVPVENNAMSGAGRDARLTDWKEQYMKNNLQLLCKEHNLDKREFKNKKTNGGEKMSDELSFEGTLASMDERVSERTQSTYGVVKFKEQEQSFSIFDTKLIEKVRGKEGKKLTIKYKKSLDGKYNNVSEVIEGEETLGALIKDTSLMALDIVLKVNSINNNLEKMKAFMPKE